MKRPWVRVLRGSCGVLFLVFCGSDHSTAEETKPRAIMAMFESASDTLPQGPLPLGLNFVLYDDGQIITRSEATQANPDPPGRGVTYGMLDREAAEGLRRDAV